MKERDEQVSRDQKRYSRVNKAKCNERYKLTTRFGVSEQQIEEERWNETTVFVSQERDVGNAEANDRFWEKEAKERYIWRL